MSRIKLVIFDLDGTLVNAFKAVHVSVNYAMKKFDLPPVSAETVTRSVGWGARNLITKFVEAAAPSDAKRLTEKVLAVYSKHHHQTLHQGVKFLPGAKKLIHNLHRNGYLLAVASNRTYHSTKLILECLKVKRYFKCVACADKIKKYKPDPGILQHILKRLKVKPSETIYIGDMTIDIQTGHAAGIKAIAVVTGSHKAAELRKSKPWKITRRIDSVEKWVYGK
jgi:phosphoglycolate phosphatase